MELLSRIPDTMKYSKDGLVLFDEKTHSYFLGEKRLTSVTKYISKYKPVFDSEKIAENYAKKNNLIKEDVLKMWREKGEQACVMGTFIHKIFEDYIKGKHLSIRSDYPKCLVAQNFIKDFFDSGLLTPVETEYIVYNNELAGQIDCIVQNKKGEFFIIDWKTNNEIKYVNKWQSMLGEFCYLDDCSFNHYSIQLSKYQELCKEYDIKKCYIVHLNDYNYDIIEVKKVKFNV